MPSPIMDQVAQLELDIAARLRHHQDAGVVRRLDVGNLRYASNLCAIIRENANKNSLRVKCLPFARAAVYQA